MSTERNMLTDLKLFNDLADSCYHGNRFEACRWVIKESRRRLSNLDTSLLESHSLTWVVTGKKPKFHDDCQAKLLRKFQRVEDLLNYIEDQEIVKSVLKSLGLSKSLNHLTYSYQNAMSEAQCTRVRILTNILWYNQQEDMI